MADARLVLEQKSPVVTLWANRRARGAWLLFSALFLLTSLATSQLYTGSISGTVKDPSGAVIVGAKVTIVDSEKGFVFNGVTDSQGHYLVRQLPPGKYSLTAEATNFQGQKKDGIEVAVNANLSVDFSLSIGAAEISVEVQSSGVQLQTQDAVTGQVIDRKFINDLPLVGRGVLDLAYLTPGITEVDNDCRGCMANNFTSNGSRNATADILLDGVSSTNFEQNSGILAPTYTPSVDAVEEFKVQQSNFSAEYGFTGATLINVITRSGTNKYHGSLYEFLRNTAFDANDWFNKQSGGTRPVHRENDFGGTIGGPIIKNKTFFFFDYEGGRFQRFSSHFFGVPTAAERTGDFGVLCTSGGGTFDGSGNCSNTTGQIYDPYTGSDPTGSGFAVNRSPIPFNNLATYASPGNPGSLGGTPFNVPNPGTAGNLIDPVAAKLIQLFPQPNLPNGTLIRNFFASGTNRDSTNAFDIKIDHQFSPSKLLSAKFAEFRDKNHSFNCFPNAADPCTGGPTTARSYLFAGNYTQTFTPTLILNVSYGVTRGSTFEQGITGDFPKLDPVTDLGFPSYMDLSGHKQYPAINLDQYSNPGNNIGNQTFSIIKEGQETHTLLGSIDWVRGKHELKFGAEGRLHRINFTQPGWPGGQFGFDCFSTSSSTNTSDVTDSSGNVLIPATNCSSASNGGDAMASLLIGTGWSNNGVYEVPNDVATQSFQAAGFVQDNYRVTPKLTLNLGLRYEISLPRTERFNRMNWLDPNISYSLKAAGFPDFPVKGGEVFASSSNRYNYDTFYKAFQPRFGFAYSAGHGFVVRGGYGIYFSQPRSGAAGTGPWGYQGYDVQTPWISTFQNGSILPGSRLSDPFRSFQAPYPDLGPKPRVGNSLGVLNDIGFGATGPIPSISRNIPYEQAWSFGIQKELPSKIVAQVDYIGKKGTHLYLGGFRDQNHLGPDFEKARLAGTLSTADINNLATNFVNNPLAPYITDPLSSLSQSQVHPYQDPGNQFHVPFPQFTSFSGDSPPIANSIYHAAQFRVEKSFSNGLEFLVTYAVSKSIDGASATDDSISWLGGGFQSNTISVQNPNNLRAERSLSVFDIPQVLQFSYVYSLPIGRGKHFGGNMHPVLNTIVGGWQLNGIWRFNNGRPVILVQTADSSIPTYGTLRPTLTAPLKANHSSEGGMLTNYFTNACDIGNTCVDGSIGGVGALAETPSFTLGNAPRTYGGVRQPGTRIVNMALFKEFPLGIVHEGMRMEFRAEAFNVFNHPQFGSVDTGFGDGSFGTITSLAQPMREMQLGLKLYF
jgi:hypothetical protein